MITVESYENVLTISLAFSHSDVVREAELLADRDERLAVPLVPDFDDEGGG